jgi:prefoldin beta subunit
MSELDLDEETKRDIVEYQNLQQQIQIMLAQRQQALAAIAELDQAKTEVEKSSGALYRFVGSVIVPKKKDELLAELKDEKTSLESRRDVFAKQEERLRKRFDELRKKLEAKLGGGRGASSGAEASESKPAAAAPKTKAKKPVGEGAVLSS